MTVADKNIHAGHRQRLLEKLLASEDNAIVRHELLEALLFYVIPREDTNPLAHRIIDTFGSIEKALEASQSDLTKVRGVGPKTAQYLKLLGVFLQNSQTLCQGKKLYDLQNPATRAYIRGLFPDIDREQVHMLFIDSRNNVTRRMLMFEGTFENVDVDMVEMFRAAITCGASGVVCVHNHPSGIAKPSRADMAATKRMQESFKLINVELTDHVIVTDKELYGIITKTRVEI